MVVIGCNWFLLWPWRYMVILVWWDPWYNSKNLIELPQIEDCIGKQQSLIGGSEHLFFPYIGKNHPNWLIFFRRVGIPPTRSWWLMGRLHMDDFPARSDCMGYMQHYAAIQYASILSPRHSAWRDCGARERESMLTKSFEASEATATAVDAVNRWPEPRSHRTGYALEETHCPRESYCFLKTFKTGQFRRC